MSVLSGNWFVDLCEVADTRPHSVSHSNQSNTTL